MDEAERKARIEAEAELRQRESMTMQLKEAMRERDAARNAGKSEDERLFG